MNANENKWDAGNMKQDAGCKIQDACKNIHESCIIIRVNSCSLVAKQVSSLKSGGDVASTGNGIT